MFVKSKWKGSHEKWTRDFEYSSSQNDIKSMAIVDSGKMDNIFLEDDEVSRVLYTGNLTWIYKTAVDILPRNTINWEYSECMIDDFEQYTGAE